MELGGDGVREGHVEQEVCGGGCMDLGKGVCREGRVFGGRICEAKGGWCGDAGERKLADVRLKTMELSELP